MMIFESFVARFTSNPPNLYLRQQFNRITCFGGRFFSLDHVFGGISNFLQYSHKLKKYEYF
jgi:hypothetical protein